MDIDYQGLQKILSGIMYTDTMDVYRREATKDEDGADCYESVKVYSGLKCKLSQVGKVNNADNTDMTLKISDMMLVCTAPIYDIRPNDCLLVSHSSHVWRLVATRAFKYPTHQEISVQLEETA